MSGHKAEMFNIQEVIIKKNLCFGGTSKKNKIWIVHTIAWSTKLSLACEQNVNNSNGIASETGWPTLHITKTENF